MSNDVLHEGHYSTEVEAEIERRANAIANTHLAVAADPKSAQKRLDQINAAEMRQREEEAGAKRREAKRAQELDEREARILPREDEIMHASHAAANRIAAAEQIEARLQRIVKDIKDSDARLRREVMNFAGLMPHFNERLMSLPDWAALANEVLPAARVPDDSAAAAGAELEQVGVENLMAGSSLSRSGRRARVEN